VVNRQHSCWQDEMSPEGYVEQIGADCDDPEDRARHPEGLTWSCCRARGDKRECSLWRRPPRCSRHDAHVWRPYSTDDDASKRPSRRCNRCAVWECDTCPRGGAHQWAFTRPGKQLSSARCDRCHQPFAKGADRSEVRNPFKKEKRHQGERELRDGWEDDYYEYSGDEDVHEQPNPDSYPEYYVWTCCGIACDEGDNCPEASGSESEGAGEASDED
jgi:hypothetical protein